MTLSREVSGNMPPGVTIVQGVCPGLGVGRGGGEGAKAVLYVYCRAKRFWKGH